RFEAGESGGPRRGCRTPQPEILAEKTAPGVCRRAPTSSSLRRTIRVDEEDGMGRICAVENVTLDGVMQSPGRPDEDTRGGFRHGGWGDGYADEVIGKFMAA